MPASILVVEDEPAITRILEIALKNEGYRVLTAAQAEIGLDIVRRHTPDLVILDIMLPKMDGLEMLRNLRHESGAPVLILSAKQEELDRVLGFKLGADDFVPKPFSVPELLLRVKGLLKARFRQAAGGVAVHVFGDLSIDLGRREVLVRGKPVRLGPLEFQVLELLVKSGGRVLSRERILDCISSEAHRPDADPRAVDQLISRLRRKLLSERSRITTVSGRGYRLRRP